MHLQGVRREGEREGRRNRRKHLSRGGHSELHRIPVHTSTLIKVRENRIPEQTRAGGDVPNEYELVAWNRKCL